MNTTNQGREYVPHRVIKSGYTYAANHVCRMQWLLVRADAIATLYSYLTDNWLAR